MSVIFGKYHIKKQPLNKADLIKMCDRLNHWEADDTGLWNNEHIGLGHLMLWNTPESLHEKLPLKSPYSGNIITADARIDNREELFLKLKITDQSVPDSTLILAAYDKYGQDCVQHLIGDFAFAIWDVNKEELFCARDHMGVKPFFYYYDGEMFIWASEMKGLLCLEEVSDELDKGYVLNILCHGKYHDSQTCYQNIQLLEPAQSLIISNLSIKKYKYWTLSIKEDIKFKREEEYLERFIFLLKEAVKSRARSNFKIGVEFSGGLDSSGISAYLIKELKIPFSQLEFYASVLPKNLDINYPYPDDKKLIVQAAKHLDIPNEHINYFDGGKRSFMEDIDLIPNILDGPLIKSTAVMAHLVGRKAVKKNVRSMISGFPGDQLVTYNGSGIDELLYKKKYLRLYGELKKQKYPFLRTIKTILTRGKKGMNKFRSNDKSIIIKNKMNEYLYQKSIEPFFSESLLIKNRQSQFITSHFIPQRFMTENITSNLFKIERRYPLADIRLLEYTLNLPLEQKVFKGMKRRIFRQAVAPYLPKEIAWGDKSENITHPSTFIPFFKEYDKVAIEIKKIHLNENLDMVDFDKIFKYLNETKSYNFQEIGFPYGRFFDIIVLFNFIDKNEKSIKDILDF